MILILFVISCTVAYISYQYSYLKLLSPTFWASAMFMLFSFIYVVTFYNMKSDITFATVLLIAGFLLVTSAGEFIGSKVTIFQKNKNHYSFEKSTDNKIEIYIAKWKVYVLTAVLMVVAADRFMNLLKAALAYARVEQFDGIMSMMSAARLAFVASNRSLVLGNTFFNQFVYLCEISAYMFVFIFFWNMVNVKKRRWYLLLPLIPDFIMRLVTTSRTAFIILFAAIVISYFSILIKRNKLKSVRIPKQLILVVFIFSVMFMIYGRVRNNASSIPIVSYLQMYTCSSIYALDTLLQEGWAPNPYFGFYTMQNIYNQLGIRHDTVRTWSKMVTFSKDNMHANLYTSLSFPIMDFGIAGCLLLRFIAAIVVTKILLGFLKKDCKSVSLYVYIFFAVAALYCYLYSPLGDVFCDYYFNPSLMIRYLVYAWFLVKFYLRPRIRKRG